MKKISVAGVVVVLALSMSACAPMYLGPRSMAGPRGIAVAPPSPVGRWDAVMILEPGSIVGLMTADGSTHTGRFVRAGADWIRIIEQGAEADVERLEVVRVDLLRRPAGAVFPKRVLGGALSGALVLAGMEMFVGSAFKGSLHTPSVRTLAGGAAAGAAAGVVDGLMQQQQRTIYVSPRIACGTPGC